MLMFVDVETTGVERFDKICSCGVVAYDKSGEEFEFYELVNEGKKISASASAIHHITNEMIKNKPHFKETKTYRFLEKYNDASSVLVAHNINFVTDMLRRSGYDFKGELVDTLRITKHLAFECDSFSLQHLRYELKLYRSENTPLVAHNALDDAKVVKNLYNFFLENTESDLERFKELSFKNVLIEKFSFGKYSGKYIEEIASSDRNYLEWMLENILDLDDDLRYSIEYFLGDVV